MHLFTVTKNKRGYNYSRDSVEVSYEVDIRILFNLVVPLFEAYPSTLKIRVPKKQSV
jgi:hypothetical protein